MGAQQWGTMTPEERQEAKQRFKQWRSLPPEQQQQLRERYQQFRQLPPEQRESVRNARRWFRSLPPEQRKELRENFRVCPRRSVVLIDGNFAASMAGPAAVSPRRRTPRDSRRAAFSHPRPGRPYSNHAAWLSEGWVPGFGLPVILHIDAAGLALGKLL